MRIALLLSILVSTVPPVSAVENVGYELVEVRKIWDAARHNAFTDLIRFDGQWICTFREASAHGNSADGKVRVISSSDGKKWDSLALLESKAGDLRDPKLSVTPDGQLMMDVVLATVNPQDGVRHRSQSFFSQDAKTWEGPLAKGDDNFWLWRSTWHDETCFVVGYRTTLPREKRFTRLYRSHDGREFEKHVDQLYEEGAAGESTLLFRKDGSCVCLLRHEATARIGLSQSPYTDWTWKVANERIGGPNVIQLADGRLVAAGRVYKPQQHMALLWLDAEEGKLTRFLKLPSGGDCSYPGLVLHDGLLWVSYYSSHEGKSSIYLAKVRID